MKTKLFLIFAIIAMAFTTVACNEFQLNEPMEKADWVICGGKWNVKDSTTRRALLVLTVKGLNSDAYTVEYTIDGMQGIGQYALTSVDEETGTKVYNWQKFKGGEYMSEEMFSGQYDGNFPSGSSVNLYFLDRKDNTHPNYGRAFFLAPKLDPGKHVIQYTVTNSYGDVYSNSREFDIQNKVDKEDD